MGPCDGIEAADQLCLSRFILIRVAESLGACIDFSPKPNEYDRGSATRVTFSTEKMRIEASKAKCGIQHKLAPIL